MVLPFPDSRPNIFLKSKTPTTPNSALLSEDGEYVAEFVQICLLLNRNVGI